MLRQIVVNNVSADIDVTDSAISGASKGALYITDSVVTAGLDIRVH